MYVMIAATRSSEECSASERTPKLSVTIASTTLIDTSTTAEPTEPSAARCLADRPTIVCFLRLSKYSSALVMRVDYTLRRKSGARRTARAPFLAGNPSPPRLIQRRWTHQRHAFRLAARPVHFHVVKQQ